MNFAAVAARKPQHQGDQNAAYDCETDSQQREYQIILLIPGHSLLIGLPAKFAATRTIRPSAERIAKNFVLLVDFLPQILADGLEGGSDGRADF